MTGESGASPATDPAATNPASATPLAKVRGLGSAREGGAHWWHERLSSVALLLLYIWLIVSLLRLPALDHRGVTEWLKQPSAAVPMLLLVAASFWHLQMGLKVAIEDYVHEEGNKFLCLLLLNFAVLLGATFGLFAVLKVAFS
jgi:succinate dehydrogenase / fumarate reductase membrane anchor subunit